MKRAAVFSALMLAFSGPWTRVAAAADPPGGDAAVRTAVEQAAEQAVRQAVGIIPKGVDTFAVLPLRNDADGSVTDRVRYHAIQITKGRAKVITRDEETLNKLVGETEWTTRRSDIMPEDELRKFGRMLGADALLYGVVRERGLDDTGLRGRAALSLYLGVVETGQLAASGNGEATVPIETETFLIGLVQKPWFWPVALGAAIVFVLFLVIWIPLRRRLALAAKPREVVR